jgi:hypothetical protein
MHLDDGHRRAGVKYEGEWPLPIDGALDGDVWSFRVRDEKLGQALRLRRVFWPAR